MVNVRKSWISYLGIAIGLFGIMLLVINAFFGDNCWGTYEPQNYSTESTQQCPQIPHGLRNCISGSGGTIVQPILCNFWFSYLFVGLTLVFGGSILYVFDYIRNPVTKIYKS